MHTNSGIPNHAFYVVATTLGGNAWDAAGPIWYAPLCDPQLCASRDVQPVRPAHAWSKAGQLYGAQSAEADAVRAAWDAVKVPL